VTRVYEHNIKHLFHRSDERLIWEGAKSKPAFLLFNDKESSVPNELKPLYVNLHKLHDITGITPKGPNWLGRAETIDELMKRGITSAAEQGKLDEIKKLNYN
jgi:hypothetical protein